MRYLLLLGCLPAFLSMKSSLKAQSYNVATQPWPESLGNHRAILETEQAAEVLALNIEWRRHDKKPEDKRFVIIHAESGDTVQNIHRLEVNSERCQLLFGPAQGRGRYYFYYLPYEVQERYGFYNQGYLKPERKADHDWLKKNNLMVSDTRENLPEVKLLTFQARTAFDSFYPMEVVALQSEKDALFKQHQNDFLIFPEDRKNPIRMLDNIPLKWIQSGPSYEFSGEAQRKEYYVFQVGVFATQKDLQDVRVEFTALENSEAQIPAANLTCFNTGGIGPYGQPFVKRVNVSRGRIQPLWIGVDISEEVMAGTYSGKVLISAKDLTPQHLDIRLRVTEEILPDRGDSETWRHSRLRWLNSTLGIDDRPTQPYQPITFLGNNTYGFTGKAITLSENGFPGSLKVKTNEILARPISLNVVMKDGIEKFGELQNIARIKSTTGVMSGTWESTSANMHLFGEGRIEADGYINYQVKLKARQSLKLTDIFLEIPIKAEIAQYMMGMGLPGTFVPGSHESKWKGPHDSFWMGNTNAGIWCELRGGSYHGPLLNLYRPEHPSSWHNGGKGGFRVRQAAGEVQAIVYSGAHDLAQGEEISFQWSILLTPVKDVDYESQFIDRYYHNGLDPLPSDEDLASGVRIVNLHHANNYNPHINYPFVAVDSMRWFVEHMHDKGQKVKIYYTIRELTNYTTELWALRSLGDEILGGGRGGGYPWLQEHLVTDYRPQWYQWFPDKSADASIVNAPGDSRWYNYYIEGLAWLVKQVDIDGLYLDDVSYDRRTVKRIRKVLDDLKPGCLLDLHSNTGFSKGPATQYAEFFPFVDKLWFGESFQYDHMPPENWLVEVSGIPFGHMGDMLHGGGNRWLGMLFGMTVRHPWLTEGVICDPRPVWKLWDAFGIDQSDMIGFWDPDPLVLTDHPAVKATAYLKDKSMLIALGNWADEKVSATIRINWKKLGVKKPAVMTLVAPEIKDFQQQDSYAGNTPIPIDPKKGWLLLLEY